MASLAPDCAELKAAYDTCFNKWYSEKFLKGDLSSDCEEVFKVYKVCLQKAIREKHIDKLISDSQKDKQQQQQQQ